jgi:hypothetical protein
MATGELQTVFRPATSSGAARLITSQVAIDAEKQIIRKMQSGQDSLAPILSTEAATAQSNSRDFLNDKLSGKC